MRVRLSLLLPRRAPSASSGRRSLPTPHSSLHCFLALLLLSACTAPSPATRGGGGGGQLGAQRRAGGGTTLPDHTTVLADWNDTEAAILAGSIAIESYLHDTQELSPTHRRYTLRLITGEEATLDITRASPPPTTISAAAAEPPVELTLTAHVGLAGDPERERRLCEAVARRLRHLKGIGAAPIR